MTCIVGIEHEDGVTIGVDSASSNGHFINTRADSKLFRVGGYLLGFTTSWRMGQLLRYQLQVSDPEGWDVDRWMATRFVDAVRKTLKDGGFASAANGVEAGGTFLVGVRGRLYTVCDDYQVGHAADGYDAVGSGAMLALGSLHTTAAVPPPGRPPLRPEVRARAALDAASAHCTTVAGPHEIRTIAAAAAEEKR